MNIHNLHRESEYYRHISYVSSGYYTLPENSPDRPHCFDGHSATSQPLAQ